MIGFGGLQGKVELALGLVEVTGDELDATDGLGDLGACVGAPDALGRGACEADELLCLLVLHLAIADDIDQTRRDRRDQCVVGGSLGDRQRVLVQSSSLREVAELAGDLSGKIFRLCFVAFRVEAGGELDELARSFGGVVVATGLGEALDLRELGEVVLELVTSRRIDRRERLCAFTQIEVRQRADQPAGLRKVRAVDLAQPIDDRCELDARPLETNVATLVERSGLGMVDLERDTCVAGLGLPVRDDVVDPGGRVAPRRDRRADPGAEECLLDAHARREAPVRRTRQSRAVIEHRVAMMHLDQPDRADRRGRCTRGDREPACAPRANRAAQPDEQCRHVGVRLVEDPPHPRREFALRERLRERCRERTLIDELLVGCAELQGRDPRTPVRIDQDVLGLEVAIEQAGLMRRRESFAGVDE